MTVSAPASSKYPGSGSETLVKHAADVLLMLSFISFAGVVRLSLQITDTSDFAPGSYFNLRNL